MGAGAGAGLGSTIGGGTPGEVRDDALSSMAVAAAGPVVGGIKSLFTAG